MESYLDPFCLSSSNVMDRIEITPVKYLLLEYANVACFICASVF